MLGATSAMADPVDWFTAAAPQVEITSAPPNPSKESTATFGFQAIDAVTIECKLDTGPFETCTSPTAYSGLTDGAHVFTVKATAEDVSVEAEHNWTIDTVAPTATIGTPPANPTNVTSASFDLSANEPATFECKLDAGGFAGCSAPTSYQNLGDGLHTFTVKATDTAGNPGPEATFSWTIDTVAPTPSITQKPPSLVNIKSASFSFSVNEQATIECKLDAGAFENCAAPTNYSDLAEGQHTFVLKATDAAGNSGEDTHVWTVDTVAPTTTIAQRPTNPSNVASPMFTFTASEPAAFKCKFDGDFTDCSSPKTYVNVSDGVHTFSVVATDPAGNPGPEAAYTWTIDTVPPTGTLTQKPGSPSSTSSPTFVFSANEASMFTCSLDHASPTSCSSPTTYTGLGDGPHYFAVTPTDAAGNTGPAITHDWTIETRAPTAAVTSGPTVLSNSSSATFTFTADEPSSFDCKLDDRGFEACGSPASYNGLGDGPHTFSVRARDPSGNLSAPAAYGWSIDATAPETVLASGPQPGTATSASFAFSASEPAVFECRLDGAPFALCGSPKGYNGLGVGEHRFEVRAVDSAGNVDATPVVHVWTISAVVPVVKTTSALQAPKAGAIVKKPPLLVWRRVSGASYYNVQVYRGRKKVLSAWPTRARLKLQARWKYLGRKQRLLPGVYRWYVWPGRGPASARRYGRLLGQSTFTVRR